MYDVVTINKNLFRIDQPTETLLNIFGECVAAVARIGLPWKHT